MALTGQVPPAKWLFGLVAYPDVLLSTGNSSNTQGIRASTNLLLTTTYLP